MNLLLADASRLMMPGPIRELRGTVPYRNAPVAGFRSTKASVLKKRVRVCWSAGNCQSTPV
jgi:hypothetical protein